MEHRIEVYDGSDHLSTYIHTYIHAVHIHRIKVCRQRPSQYIHKHIHTYIHIQAELQRLKTVLKNISMDVKEARSKRDKLQLEIERRRYV